MVGTMAAFSDAWLRSVLNKKYTGKAEITYRDGLGVRISPKGKITWIYRGILNTKSFKMKIGEYPNLKIKEAEKLKDEKSELATQGIDPRKLQTLITKQQKPQTITEIIDYWVNNHAKQNVQRWYVFESMFDKDIKPLIGAYKASSVELIDYMEVFKKARQRVSAKHSAHLLTSFKSVLSFAVRHGLLKYNVLHSLRKSDVGEPASIRTTKQDTKGLRAMWTLIDNVKSHPSNRNLLRLLMIFGCRGNELRLAKKEDFDLDDMIWTVPASNNKIRKKGGGKIVRPIPKLALPYINEQFVMYPNKTIMFPSVNSDNDLPMNNTTVSKFGVTLGELMASHGFSKTTNHDMRRTARNTWERLGFRFHVSESMLGHKVHKGVVEHYVDYQYVDEQRECYEKWCDYIINH